MVLLALTTIENAAIVISAMALYWIFTDNRKLGFMLLTVAILWFVAATKIAMPMIGGVGKPYYFSALKKPGDLTQIFGLIRAAFLYGGKMVSYFLGLPLLSLFSLVALPSTLIYAQAEAVGYGIPLNELSWHSVPVVSVLAVSSVHSIQFLAKRYGGYVNWIRVGLAIWCGVLVWISFDEVYDSEVPGISAEQQVALG